MRCWRVVNRGKISRWSGIMRPSVSDDKQGSKKLSLLGWFTDEVNRGNGEDITTGITKGGSRKGTKCRGTSSAQDHAFRHVANKAFFCSLCDWRSAVLCRWEPGGDRRQNAKRLSRSTALQAGLHRSEDSGLSGLEKYGVRIHDKRSKRAFILSRNAENVMGRLLYFGRKFPVDSAILTNPSEKDQVVQIGSSFFNQSQIVYINLRWATLIDWLFYRLIRSLSTHRFSHATFLLRLSIGMISVKSPQLSSQYPLPLHITSIGGQEITQNVCLETIGGFLQIGLRRNVMTVVWRAERRNNLNIGLKGWNGSQGQIDFTRKVDESIGYICKGDYLVGIC